MSKFKLNVYAFKDRNGKRHEGTVKEISKATGVSENYIYDNSDLIGAYWEEFEAYDKINKREIFGNIDEVTEALGLSSNYSIRNALKRGGDLRDYKVKLTGKKIFVSEEDSMIVKRTHKERFAPIPSRDEQREQIKVFKNVPAKQVEWKPSDYVRDLFEHSTRHLRRDA